MHVGGKGAARMWGMSVHEAGELHVRGALTPPWLKQPSNVGDLVPRLWPANVARSGDGILTVAGIRVDDIAREFGTPAYVLDELDFRARARAFHTAFDEAFAPVCGGADVFYAAKSFLCTEVARWIAADGLGMDVCSGGELIVALRAGMPAGRIGVHGNNKSIDELRMAAEAGVRHVVVDSFAEIERLAQIARDLGRRVPVLVRVTVGVEAHTHEFIATAHEDQKFGFSLAGGSAHEAVRRILAHPAELELRGLHGHIGSQIFDTSGFEVSARRLVELHATIAHEFGVELPELDLGGGFGIAYTTEHDPLSPAELARPLAAIIDRECRANDVAPPRISIEPGRAISGPSAFTLYEVGTVKPVELGAGQSRHYVSVDGGMSDNVRPALYGAHFSCTLASRLGAPEAVLARVVGKHCESGDIVVRDEYLPADVGPGDLIAVPGTGAYCRALSSQYNHTPRPPVIAVREGAARLIVRRETIDDILGLDVS